MNIFEILLLLFLCFVCPPFGFFLIVAGFVGMYINIIVKIVKVMSLIFIKSVKIIGNGVLNLISFIIQKRNKVP